jgi:CheY-like chemotaxis protein
MVQVSTVLMVDDDADIRKICNISLSSVGKWKVSLASSGAEGLALADSMPDVILLDVMMPGMDGLTTLYRLKENPKTTNIPVILMTAKAQQHEVEKYLSLGALGVIRKPFDPMTLPADILKVLNST